MVKEIPQTALQFAEDEIKFELLRAKINATKASLKRISKLQAKGASLQVTLDNVCAQPSAVCATMQDKYAAYPKGKY